jgi:hypothetical protein
MRETVLGLPAHYITSWRRTTRTHLSPTWRLRYTTSAPGSPMRVSVAATREALELYRTLAAHNPDAFTPDLARAQNNLGNILSSVGQRVAAVAALAAIALRRKLAACNLDAQ